MTVAIARRPPSANACSSALLLDECCSHRCSLIVSMFCKFICNVRHSLVIEAESSHSSLACHRSCNEILLGRWSGWSTLRDRKYQQWRLKYASSLDLDSTLTWASESEAVSDRIQDNSSLTYCTQRSFVGDCSSSPDPDRFLRLEWASAPNADVVFGSGWSNDWCWCPQHRYEWVDGHLLKEWPFPRQL